jgi:hypothetical protein
MIILFYTGVMNLLEEWSDGLKQCGATDNTTCASRYAWACVLHDVCTSGAVLDFITCYSCQLSDILV